jgi:hypothetical protein
MHHTFLFFSGRPGTVLPPPGFLNLIMGKQTYIHLPDWQMIMTG